MSGTYNDIIQQKIKEWKCDSLMSGAMSDRGKKIPFSSPLMNWATYGGIPRDRITEFCGEPGGGKSSTAVDVCKNAHRQFIDEFESKVNSYRERIANGEKKLSAELEDYIEIGPKKVIYIDLEHGFDGAWAETLGIEADEIDIMQPPDITAEELLQTVQALVETSEVGLIVLDSIPSLVTQAELDKKFGERTIASLAGLLTTFCRKITPLLTRYGTTLILINQIRENMENPYVIKTPGGKAVKFYSSLRILFKLGKPVDFLGNELPQYTENPAGFIINARLLKQKTAPFDRKDCSYYLMAHSGIRTDMDYAQLAIKRYGIIKKSGGWFTMCVPSTGEVLEDENGKVIKINGMSRVYDFLQSNPSYYEQLKEFILNDINGITAEQLVDEDLSL